MLVHFFLQYVLYPTGDRNKINRSCGQLLYFSVYIAKQCFLSFLFNLQYMILFAKIISIYSKIFSQIIYICIHFVKFDRFFYKELC